MTSPNSELSKGSCSEMSTSMSMFCRWKPADSLWKQNSGLRDRTLVGSKGIASLSRHRSLGVRSHTLQHKFDRQHAASVAMLNSRRFVGVRQGQYTRDAPDSISAKAALQCANEILWLLSFSSAFSCLVPGRFVTLLLVAAMQRCGKCRKSCVKSTRELTEV